MAATLGEGLPLHPELGADLGPLPQVLDQQTQILGVALQQRQVLLAAGDGSLQTGQDLGALSLGGLQADPRGLLLGGQLGQTGSLPLGVLGEQGETLGPGLHRPYATDPIAIEIGEVGEHPTRPDRVFLVEQEAQDVGAAHRVSGAQKLGEPFDLPLQGPLLLRLPLAELQGHSGLLVHQLGELPTRERQGGDVALPLLQLEDQCLALRVAPDQIPANGLHLTLERLQVLFAALDGGIRILGRSGEAQSRGRPEEPHE